MADSVQNLVMADDATVLVSAESGGLDGLTKVACLIVGLWIYAVWLVRAPRETEFRARDAKNIFEEFEIYGLDRNMVYVVGGSKLTLATVLLGAVFFPAMSFLAFYAAFGMGFLMVVAIFQHLRIHSDPVSRAYPAASMLCCCAVIIFMNCPDYISASTLAMITSVVFAGAIVVAWLKPSAEPEGYAAMKNEEKV